MSSADFAQVMQALRDAAHALPKLITDDVWPHLAAPPSERNVIGKAFSEANRLGILRPTEQFVKSRRPESKGRRVQVWESMVYDRQETLFG